MGNPNASPAQTDPCEVCDAPLNKYGLCPCIGPHNAALCTGAPVYGEIFDIEDEKWRNWALMAQPEDFNEVAIRIKWDQWDFLNDCSGEDSPDEPQFTYCEVSPKIAMKFAIKIATVAARVWIETHYMRVIGFPLRRFVKSLMSKTFKRRS